MTPLLGERWLMQIMSIVTLIEKPRYEGVVYSESEDLYFLWRKENNKTI